MYEFCGAAAALLILTVGCLGLAWAGHAVLKELIKPLPSDGKWWGFEDKEPEP